MSLQLHSVFKTLATHFAHKWSFFCMLPKVLVVVSFISVTVSAMAALVHYFTVCLLMLYKITLVGEVSITEGFLALELS